MWTRAGSSLNLLETEQMLEQQRVPYEAIDVDREFPGDERLVIENALHEYTQAKVVFPSVFVGNDYIGDLHDLEEVLKSGEIQRCLKP